MSTRAIVVGANCVRPSNVVRSLTAILESKRIDQSRQRRGLLPATGIVQKEPGERRTPVLEHTNQGSALEVLGHPVLRNPREASPIQGGLDHQVEFIEKQ